MPLVSATITDTPPGAGEVRFGMDFGNMPEVLGGDPVVSCTVSISPTTSPALTVNQGSIEIDNGHLVSALFSGGRTGTYLVTWTPTLESGQTLPPRTGTLLLVSQ